VQVQNDSVAYQNGVAARGCEAPTDNKAHCSALPVPLQVIHGDVLNPNYLYRDCFVFCPTPSHQFVVSESCTNCTCSSMSYRWFAVTSVQVYCLPSVWPPANILHFSYFTAVTLNKLGLLYGISVQLRSV